MLSVLKHGLAVEVRSPSDRRAVLVEKLQRFVGFGATLGVLFDPKHGVTIAFDLLGPTALTLQFSELYD